MDDVNDPDQETVRITLPPRPPSAASPARRETARIHLPGRNASEDNAGEVHHAPGNGKPIAPRAPIPRPPVLPGLGQPPKEPAPVREVATPIANSPVYSEAVASEPTFRPPPPQFTPPAVSPPKPAPPKPSFEPSPELPQANAGPKKETARVAIPIERPAAAPTVKMAKTQPLIPAPPSTAETHAVAVASSKSAPLDFDFISVPLCWGILAVSAVVFVIQLWNYLS